MVKTFAILLAAVVSGWGANLLPPRAQAVVDGFLQNAAPSRITLTGKPHFRMSTNQAAPLEMLPVSWPP